MGRVVVAGGEVDGPDGAAEQVLGVQRLAGLGAARRMISSASASYVVMTRWRSTCGTRAVRVR